MRVLRPFTLTPDGASYRISGALNLSAVVGPGVSEKSSSGGALLAFVSTPGVRHCRVSLDENLEPLKAAR
jgi:hypothetical protein